jgi:hypothetical protein
LERVSATFHLLDRNEVQDFLDGAAERRRVFDFDLGTRATETETLHDLSLRILAPDEALGLSNDELLHGVASAAFFEAFFETD